MSFYKYVREAWKKPKKTLGVSYRNYLIQWRRENSVTRIDKPTRLDRARSLGYKAKQGIIVARVKIIMGTRKIEKVTGGRKQGRQSVRKVLGKSLQWVAEGRANKKFPNFEVLNSYFLAKDSKHKWFEVILLDRASPVIQADPILSRIAAKRGRVYRGLTSSARKSRGLRNKGQGSEKVRPSQRANLRLAK